MTAIPHGWYIGHNLVKVFDGYDTQYSPLLPDNQEITERFRWVKEYMVTYASEYIARNENKEYAIMQVEGLIREAQTVLQLLKEYDA